MYVTWPKLPSCPSGGTPSSFAFGPAGPCSVQLKHGAADALLPRRCRAYETNTQQGRRSIRRSPCCQLQSRAPTGCNRYRFQELRQCHADVRVVIRLRVARFAEIGHSHTGRFTIGRAQTYLREDTDAIVRLCRVPGVPGPRITTGSVLLPGAVPTPCWKRTQLQTCPRCCEWPPVAVDVASRLAVCTRSCRCFLWMKTGSG